MTLNEDFATVDLGGLTFFTGCAVIQDTKNGVTKINQKTFIETIARRFDVTTTARYPATAGANLGPRMEGESSGTWPYREAIGALLWLVGWSRLEIANAVRVVARHSNDPTERHWQAVLQIIKYLLGTKDLSLTFEREPESDFDLSVYTDSNFAEKADDRRSVSGVLVCLGYSTICGFSSTQKTDTYPRRALVRCTSCTTLWYSRGRNGLACRICSTTAPWPLSCYPRRRFRRWTSCRS